MLTSYLKPTIATFRVRHPWPTPAPRCLYPRPNGPEAPGDETRTRLIAATTLVRVRRTIQETQGVVEEETPCGPIDDTPNGSKATHPFRPPVRRSAGTPARRLARRADRGTRGSRAGVRTNTRSP